MFYISKDLRNFFAALFLLSLFFRAPDASAIGIDFLGELAQPLIGPAKEKIKGVVVYIWMQPYGGYGSGKSDQTATAAGGLVTKGEGLKTSGFMYGGRGGILLANTLRLGVDYSVQSIKRNTLVETTAGGYVQQPSSNTNTMLGVTGSIDIPYTPVQGSYTHYFRAKIPGAGASDGSGWGAGISFVLKNPFILSLETRQLNYSSASDPSGKKMNDTVKQYHLNLAFMLF